MAAALILISGIVHLFEGISLYGIDISILAIGVVFGVLYIVIGVGLFAGRRLFSYLGVIVPLVGGIGGSAVYVNSPSASVLVAVAIDVIVILCCIYLLFHKKT